MARKGQTMALFMDIHTMDGPVSAEQVAGPDLAQVVEHDHAVAEQAPSLLGVRSHGASGAPVGAVSPRACG